MKKILLLISLSILFASGTYSQVQPYTAAVYDSSKTDGYYFLCPSRLTNPGVGTHAQMILDRFGDLVYYRPLGIIVATPDFKVQPNGMITFLLNGKYYVLDST